MKDWFTVEPDVVRLMQKHFTRGRGGHSIQYVTRHHLAGIGTTEDVWGWWQTRQASAHYVVENSGRIGQLVWDRDQAWSNANAASNRVSVSIEHSNSGGAAADWPINDTVIREGARLAAALCWFYKLGRPNFGTNIRDHRQFHATSCPHHLASGGRYHAEWMRIAQEHFDWMVREAAGHNTPQEGFLMALSDAEQRELLDKTRRIHHELTYGFQSLYEDPETGEQSEFRATLVGYALEADKKLETMRVQNEKES